MQFYSDPSRESDPYSLPDCETFLVTASDIRNQTYGDMITDSGWYYWHCLPGCLPDSEPSGPFASEAMAIDEARALAG